MCFNPKISIIVPIFNKGKYLSKCIESIVAQTFTDYEVLLINDGSTDDSVNICEQISAKDHRFKLVSQANSGVSAARQKGLELATGDYIIHVDPDDFVDSLFLELLYNAAVKSNADMAICDFYETTLNSERIISQKVSNNPSDLYCQYFTTTHASCCNKLIHRRCIRSDERFPIGINMCEDTIFNIRILKQIKNIEYVNQPLYHYCRYENSITNSTTPKQIYQLFQAYLLLTSITKINYPKAIPYIQSAFCGHILPRLIKTNLTYSEKKEISRKLTKNLWIIPNMKLKTKLFYYILFSNTGIYLQKIILKII